MLVRGSKKFKQCCTCRYWTGSSVRVVNSQNIEYDRAEKATCNQTGFERSAWSGCNKHQRRLDF